jgi:2-succinyl-6-hydroxy-2,4-cyclohexadiene-1-carboxylate synthase
MPNTWDALTSYPGRLRWIVGARDEKFLRIGRDVARRRPNTDLRILTGVGHNPILEAPRILAKLLLKSQT